MWDFKHTLSSRGIYITSVRLDINGWSDSDPIAGVTICQTNTNLARIGFNNDSNTMLRSRF